MKRSVWFICLLLISPVFLFAQKKEEGQENPVRILKSPDGIMYTNNTEGAYFSIDFKGDTLVDAGISNGFKIDEAVFQVVMNPYESSDYSNFQDSIREIALLEKKMKWELDYISDEVFKRKVTSGYEVFKNKDGKNYFLWHYVSPVTERKDPGDVLVVEQYYLTFVANQFVVGVCTPIFEKDDKDLKRKQLRELADRIDVFGARIDVDGLFYKMDARSNGKDLQYVDSANGYTLTLHDWFNITESPRKNIYIGTLPDIDNIQNAIMVQKFKKAEFSSFKDFNEQIFPAGLKSGDKFAGGTFLLKKEQAKPSVVNGISARISLMRGSRLYETHYTTIETRSAFLFVVFTATPETFTLNHPRFLEFVENIEVMK